MSFFFCSPQRPNRVHSSSVGSIEFALRSSFQEKLSLSLSCYTLEHSSHCRVSKDVTSQNNGFKNTNRGKSCLETSGADTGRAACNNSQLTEFFGCQMKSYGLSITKAHFQCRQGIMSKTRFPRWAKSHYTHFSWNLSISRQISIAEFTGELF